MAKAMVIAEGLGKRLRRVRAGDTLVQHGLRWLSGKEGRRWVWALRDVNLTVEEGEAVGIIGPNGAGKSTLLKTLAGVYRPDAGRVRLGGRVTSLIELGAGFHAELSGRENVYLNAAIMGLSPRALKERFAQIVEFAELDEVIDAPLKHYSTGMHARLGFSVAIHLDPEILLLDEVLSVGDIAFQNKCADWLRGFRRGGKTIFFVSHNLSAVELLYNRVVWLDEGRIRMEGEPKEVTRAYVREMERRGPQRGFNAGEVRRWGTGRVRYEKVELLDEAGRAVERIRTGAPCTLRAVFRSEEAVDDVIFRLRVIASDLGVGVFSVHTGIDGKGPVRVEGCGELLCRFDALPLEARSYEVWAAIYPSDLMCHHDIYLDALRFEVLPPEGIGSAEYSHRELVRLPYHLDLKGGVRA